MSNHADPVDSAARVLVLHNRYQERGGEDVEYEAEVALLRKHGHDVSVLERVNSDIRADSLGARARLFAQTVWSTASYKATRTAIRESRPDVVHVHNSLPLLSPSVYHAAWAERVPVVQSLHNYRLICPAALLRRNGRICEDCVGHSTLPGFVHACYRGSRAASLGVVAMIETHRVLRTYRRVEAYIALSEFQRAKLVAGGLPAERLHVKPNFVDWHFPVRAGAGEYALYAGRLSPEKGIQTLVDAWVRAGTEGVAGLTLKVAGTGPLSDQLRQVVASSGARVAFLGFRSQAEIAELLARARYLVYPSELYEPLGITVIESFAAGVPVIASCIGALEHIVEDNRTGIHFVAGDAEDLLRAAHHLTRDLQANARMGRFARETYLARYTPEQNYQQLVEIYSAAAERAGARTR